LEHKIQILRKEAKLDYTDRINFYYQGSEKISNIIKRSIEELKEEILAVSINEGDIPEGIFKKKLNISGEEIFVGFVKI